MTEFLVKSSVLDSVMTVTVNRPEKANSLTPDMLVLLRDQFRQVADENTVRAVIVTGAGNRVFCAGADLNTLHHTSDGTDPWFDMTEALRTISVPTIAAINGPCMGGGVSMALACDMRLAVPEARFYYPVLANNLMPGQYDIDSLLRLIGPGRTSMLLLTGAEVSSKEACDWGLVDRLVEVEELDAACQKLSRVPAEADGAHLQALKTMLRESES